MTIDEIQDNLKLLNEAAAHLSKAGEDQLFQMVIDKMCELVTQKNELERWAGVTAEKRGA